MEEFENLIVEKLMSTERDGMKDLIAAMKNDEFSCGSVGKGWEIL